MRTNLPLVACSLTAQGQRERVNEWKTLLAAAESREELLNGTRYVFRREYAERIRTLAALEQECCSFLRFDVTEAPHGVAMTVEADDESGLAALR
jgi:hypothetical protein